MMAKRRGRRGRRAASVPPQPFRVGERASYAHNRGTVTHVWWDVRRGQWFVAIHQPKARTRWTISAGAEHFRKVG